MPKKSFEQFCQQGPLARHGQQSCLGLPILTEFKQRRDTDDVNACKIWGLSINLLNIPSKKKIQQMRLICIVGQMDSKDCHC